MTFYRVAITMLVSAYWHGIHGGYYLGFLTIPLCLYAEDLIMAVFHRKASKIQQQRVEWFVWFFKMRIFDYMSMSFLLLTYENAMAYWGSVYFVGHVWLICFVVVSTLCAGSRPLSNKT